MNLLQNSFLDFNFHTYIVFSLGEMVTSKLICAFLKSFIRYFAVSLFYYVIRIICYDDELL